MHYTLYVSKLQRMNFIAGLSNVFHKFLNDIHVTCGSVQGHKPRGKSKTLHIQGGREYINTS